MPLRSGPRIAISVLALLVVATSALAQLRRIPAEIAALVESDGVRAGSTIRAALKVALPEGYHVQSDKPRDPTLIATELSVEAPAGVQVEEIVFPEAEDFKQEGLPEPLLVFEREFVIGVRLSLPPTLPAGPLTIPARLRYQACDDKMCYAPSNGQAQWTLNVVGANAAVTPQHADIFGAIAFGTGAKPGTASAAAAAPVAAPGGPDGGIARLDRFTVVASNGGYLGTGDFLTFIKNAESGVVEKGLFEGQGPLAILLIVLVGGLALNLTPCVLPMIPINLAIIGAGAQAASRRRGFLLGLTYGGAMAFVYGVLGLIVVLTASTFGTINASPWFNLGIALLFVALALAMFDVFEIDFSKYAGNVGAGAGRGSFLLAFTMGAVAAQLAGACVAPVVIQVVLFASNLYSTGTPLALALPFFLGIGMAIPWPVAGAGLASLPKPGPWMVRVKQAFGVLILGTSLYYGYLAYELFSNRWVDATEVASSVEEKLKEGWHSTLAAGLAAAERENKPVLVDLWATWCKNCLTMDKTTLVDPSVKQALDGYVKIKFQAEQPDEPPAVDVMKRFNAVGLPAYVILKPGSPTISPAGN
jgi:cytochrome c biogenesis protein CcdA/DsbC/DsbD-like thiol-disulfide interchange protein